MKTLAAVLLAVGLTACGSSSAPDVRVGDTVSMFCYDYDGQTVWRADVAGESECDSIRTLGHDLDQPDYHEPIALVVGECVNGEDADGYCKDG